MALLHVSKAGSASLASEFVTLYCTFVFPDDAELEPSRSADLSRPTELHTYRMTEVFVSVSTMAPQPAVAEGIPYRQRTDEDGTRCADLCSLEC